MPAVREHLTPNHYVEQTISFWLNELSLLRLDPDEQLKLDEQDFIAPKSTLTSPKTIIEVPTKNMLIVYMKAVEKDVIYHQCLMIKILNLIIIN